MIEINELALKDLYESRKADYVSRRRSGEKSRWDEQYKWDLLPRANQELAKIENIDQSTIGRFIDVVNEHKSNFAHWIDMDDLNLLVSHTNGYKVIQEVWRVNPSTVHIAINTANNISNMMVHKKFSPSTFGYLLAAQNCNEFVIYRDAIYKEIADRCLIPKPGSYTQGERFQFFNMAALYIGELMKADSYQYDDLEWHTALNGQDFLYVTSKYSE